MELPSFFGDILDSEIINNVWFWIFLVASEICFIIGFKLADNGAFGLLTTEVGIPILTKIGVLLLDIPVVYLIAMKWLS